MNPLNPITIAFIGLFLGLWIEGMAFLGAYPEEEGGAPVAPTLALGGFILAGITLLFGGLWLLLSTRVPEALGLNPVYLLLSGTMTMYGIILLFAGIAQFNGWDLRPVGQLAIAGTILQLFMTPALIAALPPVPGSVGLTIALVLYIILIAGLFLFTLGKLPAKLVGLVALLASLASLWVAVGFTQAVSLL